MAAETIPILDPSDPRIASYRDVREKDLEGREGLFVAEGEVVLRVLASRGRFPVVSVLLDERRVASLGDVIAGLPPNTKVYVTRRGVMESIVGFPIHRGVLALGQRSGGAGDEDADALLRRASMEAERGAPVRIVGLVGLSNHDNVGGVFRNAAAFGASCVVYDAQSCDPLYRKSIRVSSGCALTVPFARVRDVYEMLALLERHRFTALATTPRGTTLLHELRPPDRAAVLLGAEGPGLPDDVLAREGVVSLRIPIAPAVDSLNVATTGALVLHALQHPR